MHSFFATISRMKYIERWALMRSSRPENLSEHALEVASIAHALCTIGNVRYGRELDADRAALLGLYHDATEIITGDMPTPVKYHSRDIRQAYRHVEEAAARRLLTLLPEDLRPAYEEILLPDSGGDAPEEEIYLRRLVKAADKLSALAPRLPSMRWQQSSRRSGISAGSSCWLTEAHWMSCCRE